MGQITATNGTLTRTFSCAQYALMGDTLPAGWAATANTCGQYFGLLRSPEASFGLELNSAVLPGGWHSYEVVIVSDEAIVPTSAFLLPTNPDNVVAIVRRQQYHATVPGDSRDFVVDNVNNKIIFSSALNLSGQTCYVRAFR